MKTRSSIRYYDKAAGVCFQSVYKIDSLHPSTQIGMVSERRNKRQYKNIPHTTILYFDVIPIAALNIFWWLNLILARVFNRFCSIFAYFSTKCRLTNSLIALKIRYGKRRRNKKKKNTNDNKLETGCHISVWKWIAFQWNWTLLARAREHKWARLC